MTTFAARTIPDAAFLTLVPQHGWRQFKIANNPIAGLTTPPPSPSITISPQTTVGKLGVVTVTVTGYTALRRVYIWASYSGVIDEELVHTGFRFGSSFTGPANTRISSAAGFTYTFTLLRDGGWPGTPRFTVDAVDAIGTATLLGP